MEKIDLRKTATGVLPPDIAQLIEKAGGLTPAERMAGVAQGTFGKIRRGIGKHSEMTKARVKAALEGNPIKKKEATVATNTGVTTVPETCPPLLADLIKHCGSKAATCKALGTSDGTLYGVINGKPMPPAWITRAKAKMGMPVIAPREEEKPPEVDAGPPFVMWDGKTLETVTLRAQGGKKPRKVKLPPTLAALVNRYEGNLSQCAQSMGHTSGALTGMLTDAKRFTEKWQRKVHASLHGLAPGQQMTQDYDKYEMGFAMVLVNGAANFDRILDIAEILNGRIFFKKDTKTGWWLFIKMATDDLPRFKKLGMRDAQEIVCP